MPRMVRGGRSGGEGIHGGREDWVQAEEACAKALGREHLCLLEGQQSPGTKLWAVRKGAEIREHRSEGRQRRRAAQAGTL